MQITRGRLKQIIKEEMDRVQTGFDDTVGDQDQELDYEGYMTKSQLYKIGQYALEVHDMLNDGDNLPEWMQSKVAQMEKDIGSVKHALEYDKKRGTV
ncbi:MAG: hypothetical protein RIR47_1046 [Bacteroidota bacterium]|jgi:hypothetical protein